MPDPLMINVFRSQLSPRGNRQLTQAIWLNVCAGVLEGLALLSILPLVEALSTGQPCRGLSAGGWLIVLAVLAAVTGVLVYRQNVVGYAAAMDFIRTGHTALGDHLATLPLGWFGRQRSGTISQLVSSGFMAVGESLAHIISVIITNGTAMLIILIGSWFWDVRLGLALTIAGPIAGVIMMLAQRIKRRSNARVRPTEQELASRIVEFATCQPALRAAGHSRDFAPLAQAHRRNHAASIRDLWVSSGALLLTGMVTQMVVVVLVIIAALGALAGTMSAVAAITFIGLTLRFSRNLDNMGQMLVGVEMARQPLTETRDIMSTPILPEPTESTPVVSPGSVELDHVTFGYGETPVVRDVSLKAAPGTMVAIVGPSGSGKTTIARLIARFWDVDSGAVRVGGVDVREQTTADLMTQLSLVFQDVYLFDDTLWENIRVGREDATDEEIAHAASLAGVDTIAQRMEKGWNTRVGEAGRSLSGGERQRVSVARALLKKSPIVLFDEATSALDADNEAAITASVEELRTTSTFIVIAHKLSTVVTADTIVVLNPDGSVAEQGTHEQLIAHPGPYTAFWRRRQAAAGWTLSKR
ncbi:ABC transporter ATP-binding protein [Corynebacterium uberis]|uniref:ABC transporter ATP-binding protein n=1 Tax=Corynebacterium TaxID=1716 RepID=UPI001D0AA42D|nr:MULTISPECIES: ABC transporter ATP-binding protein [Corynebacterium]MCZ9308908.1 ABC transporter ATP-binding protein/permease [Corynebacterium sp. c6VSa_13]UDL74618.1 ABC transporter ATP-binding protein/permease [Corynebacterium uberis]UDL76548.1 ABC transporter ATP-binding protein/permease [Corynebacterium uberis]UDL78761.1 ABC transporter ATP-binding protein/permease [Corynebacterium uberis]UDL81039.1 ABC transporter ATP-binding protein/permease [Corynebacterium uberis]